MAVRGNGSGNQSHLNLSKRKEEKTRKETGIGKPKLISTWSKYLFKVAVVDRIRTLYDQRNNEPLISFLILSIHILQFPLAAYDLDVQFCLS